MPNIFGVFSYFRRKKEAKLAEEKRLAEIDERRRTMAAEVQRRAEYAAHLKDLERYVNKRHLHSVPATPQKARQTVAEDQQNIVAGDHVIGMLQAISEQSRNSYLDTAPSESETTRPSSYTPASSISGDSFTTSDSFGGGSSSSSDSSSSSSSD